MWQVMISVIWSRPQEAVDVEDRGRRVGGKKPIMYFDKCSNETRRAYFLKVGKVEWMARAFLRFGGNKFFQSFHLGITWHYPKNLLIIFSFKFAKSTVSLSFGGCSLCSQKMLKNFFFDFPDFPKLFPFFYYLIRVFVILENSRRLQKHSETAARVNYWSTADTNKYGCLCKFL